MVALGRRFGIHVEAVSIGFGPIIWRRRRTLEVWRFKLLPLGGYVQFQGMADDDPLGAAKASQPGSYLAAPPGIRFLIAAAGPLSILAVGIILLGVPVWCGANQLVAEGPVEQAPWLEHAERPSAWADQFQLAQDTAGNYFARLCTFRSMPGWGAFVAWTAVIARAGDNAPLDWVSLLGVTALAMGMLNLVPL